MSFSCQKDVSRHHLPQVFKIEYVSTPKTICLELEIDRKTVIILYQNRKVDNCMSHNLNRDPHAPIEQYLAG